MRELAAKTAVVRPRNQITVPAVILAVLGADLEDVLRFVVMEDGRVEVQRCRLYIEPPPLAVEPPPVVLMPLDVEPQWDDMPAADYAVQW